MRFILNLLTIQATLSIYFSLLPDTTPLSPIIQTLLELVSNIYHIFIGIFSNRVNFPNFLSNIPCSFVFQRHALISLRAFEAKMIISPESSIHTAKFTQKPPTSRWKFNLKSGLTYISQMLWLESQRKKKSIEKKLLKIISLVPKNSYRDTLAINTQQIHLSLVFFWAFF